MIKFAVRRNLIYPLQYLLWSIIRDIEVELTSFFLLNNLIITTPIMFFGEFLAGLIFYLHQKKNISKNKTEQGRNSFVIKFMKTKHKIVEGNKFEIIFIIFTIAFFDFVQFILTFPLSKFINLSGSLEKRLRGTYTIVCAIFSYYKLGLPIFKHQYFSLIAILICIIIVIST